MIIEEDFDEEYYFDEDEDINQIESYLYGFDKDDLVKLANKLDIKCDNFENLSEDNLISKILFKDEDTIKEICEDLFDYGYDEFIIDNEWKHSNYESKDINDWDVDDHLAAWFDHMMDK